MMDINDQIRMSVAKVNDKLREKRMTNAETRNRLLKQSTLQALKNLQLIIGKYNSSNGNEMNLPEQLNNILDLCDSIIIEIEEAVIINEKRALMKELFDKLNISFQDNGLSDKVKRDGILNNTSYSEIDKIQSIVAKINNDNTPLPVIIRSFGELQSLVIELQLKDKVINSIVWVEIPAGSFLYGTDLVRRKLPGYKIMKYPVTVFQYSMFCEATKHDELYYGRQEETHPVVNVDNDDAIAFAKWVGLALPTEEEWEKAARGTDGREYPWGNDWESTMCCNGVGKSTGQISSVGSFSVGDSPYSVCDMSGNVWEWCDNTRVLRGGSWCNTAQELFRVTYRGYLRDTTDSNVNIGFRCVLRLSDCDSFVQETEKNIQYRKHEDTLMEINVDYHVKIAEDAFIKKSVEERLKKSEDVHAKKDGPIELDEEFEDLLGLMI